MTHDPLRELVRLADFYRKLGTERVPGDDAQLADAAVVALPSLKQLLADNSWIPISDAPTTKGAKGLLVWGGEVVPGIYVDNSDTRWPWKGWSLYSGQPAKIGQPTLYRPFPSAPETTEEGRE